MRVKQLTEMIKQECDILLIKYNNEDIICQQCIKKIEVILAELKFMTRNNSSGD